MVMSSILPSCGSFLSNLNFQPTFPIISTTKSISLTLKTANSTRSSLTGSVSEESKRSSRQDLLGRIHHSCPCCARRHFFGALIGAGFLPISPSFASNNSSSSPHDAEAMEVLNRIHPPRPDWYEEFYASAMDKTMQSYESEISGYKSGLFANLRGKANKILEIGVGTGPNLKYYAEFPGVEVIGVDPNRKMEKYAKVAAAASGLPPSKFKFVRAVAEALPLNDASVDAVVGTLVLCSAKDVDKGLQEVKRVLKPGGIYVFVEHVAAKDGTLLRFVQGILDPLQQTVADGCHLTRNTATNITRAGFSSVDVNWAVLSSASLINPHVYGIALR